MNQTFTVDYLDAGSVASLPIRIPVVSLGAGPPVLSILCGVHGDETAGVMVSHRLMKRLSAERSIAGTVRILPSANPFAQATRSRVAFSDYGNLNRAGMGKAEGRATERLAHLLYEYLSDSALVIDLHEFRMDTPTMALHIPGKDAATDRTILENIAALEPAFVWAIPSDPTSLVGALVGAGVPGFGVETSDARVVTDDTLHDLAEGLFRVAQNLGIVQGRPHVAPVTAYDIKMVRADRAGLWEPVISLFDTISERDAVGTIIPFPLVEEHLVVAPSAGTIVQLARRQLVDTGTNLYAIGQVNRQVTDALRLAVHT
jgi:predicted deacylase